MKKLNSLQKKTAPLLGVCVLLIGIVAFQAQLQMIAGATQEEAFTAITEAFEVVEQASKAGLEVEPFVAKLNDALEEYTRGNYDKAITMAQEVKEDVSQLLSKFRWDKLYPYLIALLNLTVILVVIFGWGRKIWGWFVKQREEEYLDLEIVYEEEKKDEQEEQQNKRKERKNR